MEPSPGGNAVGHVSEFVGSINLDKVFKYCCLDEVRMKLSYTVDFVASNGREVSHLHHLWLGFLNDGDTSKQLAVLGKLLLHHLEESHINLVYDLEMSWQQVLHHRDRPFL